VRPLTLVVYALLLFLYAPLIVAVLFAFNSGGNLSWPLKGLSLRWFDKIFSDPSFSSAMATSAQVATVVALLAVVIGTAAAFVFARRRTRTSAVVEAMSMLPVMLPPLLIGVSMLTAIAAFAIPLSLTTIAAGHLVYVVPYVIVVVAARLRTFDPQLEEAGRDLGERPVSVLRRVTLPVIAPAVLGAGMLAFAFSFDEIQITNFTAGQSPTLPVYVFSAMRRSVDPSINAVATVLLVVPWVAFLLGALILGRSLRALRWQPSPEEAR
jgi:ABC-type spermidine/putrescine transport system permease subunit II